MTSERPFQGNIFVVHCTVGTHEYSRYNNENFPKILQLADGLKKVGEKYKATAGQVALAWLLAQGDDVIPIPGTTKINVSHLQMSLRY